MRYRQIDVARPTLHEIENAFQPAKEAGDPNRFAGRKDMVEEAYRAILSEGAHLALIGGRGMGKTSLAKQIQIISAGNPTLLDRLDIQHDGPCDFLAVYFACGNSVSSIDDLLVRLITSKKCLADWIYDIPKAKKIMEQYEPKFNVGLVSLGGRKATESTSERAGPSHPIDVVFTNIAATIADQCGASGGLLIIVDEFDQISNPSGFAPFLKSLATNAPNVRFCIVGVAHDIQRLMQEHESTNRLFVGAVINVLGMAPNELNEIVDIAERTISNTITFDSGARRRLVDLANMHPYMVHLLGKLALRAAHRNGNPTICDDDILTAIQSMAETGGDPVLEGRYKRAIGASAQREVVLRALAEKVDTDGEVHTTTTYKCCMDEGVENPSQYVGNLVMQEYGAEIEKIRERFYRFRDSLFHTYVLVRPRYFAADIE